MSKADSLRIPAVMSAEVTLTDAAGDVVDCTALHCATRDISEFGLCLELKEVPLTLARRLENDSLEVKATIRAGRQT